MGLLRDLNKGRIDKISAGKQKSTSATQAKPPPDTQLTEINSPTGPASKTTASENAKMPQQDVSLGVSTRAYERDYEEGRQLEQEKHLILSGTVQRIRLGQILTSETVFGSSVRQTEAPGCTDDAHMQGYVWGLGERPKGMAGGLKIVVDNSKKKKEEEGSTNGDEFLYEQLTAAVAELKKHALPLEEGPYADKNSVVRDFTEKLFKGVVDDAKRLLPNSKEGVKLTTIERVIDLRPFITAEIEQMMPRVFPIFNFFYNEDFMTPDNLPFAGEILSQKRLVSNSVTGASQFYLVHPMEQYILAVAALRRRGYDAYPAHAVVPEMDGSERTNPLIVIVDLVHGPLLTTFDMMRYHPPMGAIDILSDVAVTGALHAMVAEARIKHLTTLMVQEGREGRSLELETIKNQLERISHSLFQCAKRWGGCPFIPRAKDYLFHDLCQAFLAIDSNMALPDTSAQPIMTGQGIRFPTYAEVSASNYVDYAMGVFAKMFAKAEKE